MMNSPVDRASCGGRRATHLVGSEALRGAIALSLGEVAVRPTLALLRAPVWALADAPSSRWGPRRRSVAPRAAFDPVAPHPEAGGLAAWQRGFRYGWRHMADERDGRRPPEDDRKTRLGRLGEQLTGLLDPESALRKGQDLVSGVTQATKEELMRIVSAEMRSVLDKMDAVDLLQQVIAGLVVDVHMQVRFSRASDGVAQPRITKQETQIRTREETEE